MHKHIVNMQIVPSEPRINRRYANHFDRSWFMWRKSEFYENELSFYDPAKQVVAFCERGKGVI